MNSHSQIGITMVTTANNLGVNVLVCKEVKKKGSIHGHVTTFNKMMAAEGFLHIVKYHVIFRMVRKIYNRSFYEKGPIPVLETVLRKQLLV